MKRLNRKNLIALATASAVAIGGFCAAPVQAQNDSSPVASADADPSQSSSDKSSADDKSTDNSGNPSDADSPGDGSSSGSSDKNGKLDSDKITDWIKVVSVVVTLLTSIVTLMGKFNNFKF